MASSEKVRSSSAAPLLAKKYETGQTVLATELSEPAPESNESGNRALVQVDTGAQNWSEEEAVWQA